MNDVIPFTHETFGTVRSVLINDNPWFVANDICRYFGVSNPRNITTRLYDEEKGVCGVDTLGGNQQMTVVNESGLYHMLFSMEPKQARNITDKEIEQRHEQIKQFKYWITSEVIPSIRKNGIYATTETIDKILDDPDFGIRLLQQLKDEREKNSVLQSTVEWQAKKIEEDAPKVTYYDLVLQSPNLLATKDIAGDYGMTAQTMNKLLHEFGVQYKTGSVWHLYAKYNGKGYAKTTTETFHNHTRLWLKWSQQGRLFIYDLMKEHGYLPSCEQITA